jgi:DNA-binding NtrC family response regulator
MGKTRILIVEDDEDIRKSFQVILARQGYAVDTAATGDAAIARFANGSTPDVVLTDLRLPGQDGLDVLKAVKARTAETQVIMMSGFATVESAVETTKAGAYGYLVKPITPDSLLHLIGKAIEEQRLSRENAALRRELAKKYGTKDLHAHSARMRELCRTIEEVAATDANLLIQGESGTGKEFVARTIHALSARRAAPYVSVNIGGFTETLLESELFGHTRGAFTGALRDTPGLFRSAEGGTLLLDEISETTPAMQVKLLRVIQEKEVRPVGNCKDMPINVRFLAATNRCLTDHVKSGQFREDLYYRLNVITIDLPPLRERVEDIPLFVEHFLSKFKRNLDKRVEGVSPEAMTHLMTYPWPGNIRELEHAMERAVTLSRSLLLQPEDFPASVVRGPENAAWITPRQSTLAEIEKAYLVWILHQTHWNVTRAAGILGLHRTTMHRKIRDHRLTPPPQFATA